MEDKLIENDQARIPSIAGEVASKKTEKKFPWCICLVYILGFATTSAIQTGLTSEMSYVIRSQPYQVSPSTSAIASSLGTGLSLLIAPIFGNLRNSMITSKNSCLASMTQMLTINKYLLLISIISMVIVTFFWLPQLGSYSYNFYFCLLAVLATPCGTIQANLATAWVYSFLEDTNHLATMFALYHIFPIIGQIVGQMLGDSLKEAMSLNAYLSVNVIISLILLVLVILTLLHVNAKQVRYMLSDQNAITNTFEGKEEIKQYSNDQNVKKDEEENMESIICTMRRVASSALFQNLLFLPVLAGYFLGSGPTSTLYTYFFMSVFEEIDNDQLNDAFILTSSFFMIGMLLGSLLSSPLGRCFGPRRLATSSMTIAAFIVLVQSFYMSAPSPGMPQIYFGYFAAIAQGILLAQANIAVGAMLGISIDYEFLYSGLRKEAMFSTIFVLIQVLVGALTSSFLQTILSMLGYRQNTNADDEPPISQNQGVKIFLIACTNYAMFLLYLLAAIALYRFPADKKEHDLILKELREREKEPLTYTFHDPIYPENSESNQSRISFFTHGEKISVKLQKEMESFFYYFSSTEMQLLQEEKGGKYLVQNRFKLDLTLLTCYTLIFFACMIAAFTREEGQVAALDLLLLLVSAFFWGYQFFRYSAMRKLQEMSPTEIIEHVVYCGKRRLIEHTKDVNRYWLFIVRLLPNAVAIFFVIIAIILASSPHGKFEQILTQG